jgi:hypothetical protein
MTYPPKALIKTWLDLMRSTESDVVRDAAKTKLMNAFGSIENMVCYIKDNDLT